MSDRWSRLAPLTGIVFVALLAATFSLAGSTPGVHSSGAKVLAFYRAHHGKEMLSNFLGGLGVCFFLFFAAALWGHLRRADGARALTTLGFGGAVLLGVGGASFAGLGWALADARKTLDPSAAQALNVLSNDFFWPLAAGVAVFMIGNGLAIARTGALPAWLGWIAIVVGIAALTPAGFFAFLAVMAWTLVAAVLVYLNPSAPPPPAAAPPAS